MEETVELNDSLSNSNESNSDGTAGNGDTGIDDTDVGNGSTSDSDHSATNYAVTSISTDDETDSPNSPPLCLSAICCISIKNSFWLELLLIDNCRPDVFIIYRHFIQFTIVM
jgi:hypothetical protein